jgi:hypothetical protein
MVRPSHWDFGSSRLLKKWNLFNNLLLKLLDVPLFFEENLFFRGTSAQFRHSRKLLKNRIRFFNSLLAMEDTTLE